MAITIKYGENSIDWSDIANLNEVDGCALSVLTTDNVTIVLRIYATHALACDARTRLIQRVSEAGEGGTVIIIDDDDF